MLSGLFWLMSSSDFERRVVLVGETGAGKSTVGNRLVRWTNESEPFLVGNSFESVTKNVECYRGTFVEVCDTPGLGATEDFTFPDLTHGMIYVHNAEQPRMTKAAKKSLKLAARALGEEQLSRRLLVVVTRSTGSRIFRDRLNAALCRKIPSLCQNPAVVAFAGTRSSVLDFATLTPLRFRRTVADWLYSLPENPLNTSKVSTAPRDRTGECQIALEECRLRCL